MLVNLIRSPSPMYTTPSNVRADRNVTCLPSTYLHLVLFARSHTEHDVVLIVTPSPCLSPAHFGLCLFFLVQLFNQSFGMFMPAGEEGRVLWFNKDCVWADEEYGLVGLIIGLAVHSGVILDVPLPLVIFRKVLGQKLTLRVS